MGKIYIGQIGVQLTATVSQDVTSATCLIKYKKPDGETGSFAATIVTAATGVIRYTTDDADDLDQAGVWIFWGHVAFSGGNVAAGEPYKEYIYDEGY